MKPKALLQAAGGVLKARLLKQKAPLIVGWAITDHCNRKCSYCDIWQRPPRDLPTDQVLSIINALVERGAISISFTGGEPLLRKDMGTIIDYVHEQGVGVKINTNGTLVKQRIRELKNLHAMNLSLEGPAEIHDAIRGPGSYQEVMEAIGAAQSQGITAGLATVLTRINLGAIDHILDVARQKNCQIVFQPATTMTLGGWRQNDLTPPVASYREAVQKLIDKKRQGDNAIGNSLSGLKHLYQWPDPVKMRCASGWVSCRIEPDGTMMYCSRGPRLEGLQSCTEIGVRAAFDKLGPITCQDCWCAGRVELNLAFSGKPAVIKNHLSTLLSVRTK